MNRTAAAGIQPGAVSGGMLWLVGAAFALTQLTSLALGPAANRQLHISLSVPAVELEDAPGSVDPATDTVLGAISTAVRASATPARVVASQHLSSPAASTTQIATSTVIINTEPGATSTSPVIKAHGSRHDDNGVERRAGKVAAQD
jgi:hypothetical protein